MEEFHSVIAQDGFGHVVDENGEYYQPTIKTARNDNSKVEYDINIYGNLMIIDNEKQNIKVVEVPSIKKLFDEKQQLISFLKNKIKEYKLCFPEVVKALQEVIDFINKGGKE